MNEPSLANDSVLAAGRHFGNLDSVQQIGALTFAESTYAPRMVTPVHAHECASFTLLISGDYAERYPRRTIDCRTGSILFRPASELHSDRMGAAGARCLMVELPTFWCERMGDAGIAINEPRHSRDTSAVLLRMRRELSHADSLSGLALEALTMLLACAVERSQSQRSRIPVWLARVRERAESEFRNLPSLQELANEAGVHPAHLARRFHEQYGTSIGELARNQRVQFCIRQLREGKRELCDIAADAGFASQSHFVTAFRKSTGRTPAEFRRNTRMHRA